jgi:predicted PurR-regulated permease PerM
MPLPSDLRTFYLGGLFLFALFTALYVTREIVLPLTLAIVLKLVLQPVVRALQHLRIPRGLAALAAVLLLMMIVIAVGTGLGGPAASWAAKLPEALPKLQAELPILQRPIGALRDLLGQVRDLAQGAPPASGTIAVPEGLLGIVFNNTSQLFAGLFTVLLFLFYFLVFGETFLRRVVEILPTFRDKREAVELSIQIEHDVSIYMFTISAINAIVGLATFVIMRLCSIPDPLLWGVLAMLLNFVPIIGPLGAVVLFTIVGTLASGITWWALLPAGLYFMVHLVEGEVVSPLIVARRFTINPIAIIVALIFWYWFWGVLGAFLAVPMLAISKIICDRLRPLRAFGHLLAG